MTSNYQTMVAHKDSVYEQITQLSQKISKQHTARHPLEHCSPSVIVRRLRTISYGILLNKSRTSYSCAENNEKWDALSQILAYSYKLHECRQTTQAMRLYDLISGLSNAGWDKNPTVDTILLFLVHMAGHEVQVSACDTNLKRVPLICKPVNRQTLKIASHIRPKPYEEFPPHMFELTTALNIQNNTTDFLFIQEPGMGLEVLGKFGARAKVKQHPLVEFNFCDLTKPRDLVIPKEASAPEQQDEGYVSPSQENTMSGSCMSTGGEPLGGDAWETVLTMGWPVPRSWATIGSLAPQKEKPFLTDAGMDCVQKVWKVIRGHSVMYMNKSLAEHVLLTDISRKQLIQDLKFLLIGVPSETFPYDEEENGFVMKNGVCVQGVTPETLRSFCEKFLVTGTCCLRLRKLVECKLITGNHAQEGLMFQALCGNIRSYLHFYRAAVMMLPEDPVLTRLLQQVDGLHIQMTYLGHLYKVHPSTRQDDVTLPEGVMLLSYLYEEICKVTRKDVACILYSAMHSCCQVYFSFVQKWIFEGLCQDAYTEFFIQEQPDLMTSREREYWSRGYYMIKEAVPGFLQGLDVAIFQCGKALNLLKLCNPQDALCVVLQSGYPAVRCCLHTEDLQQLEAECLSYERGALAACGEPLELHHYFQSMKEEEHAFEQTVQTAHQASLQRLKLEHDMKASKVLKEKNAQFAILKEQMEMAEARKADERKQRLQEDERFAREAAQLEQETARRTELEKADLVRYYSVLTDVAEKRLQHAEWRISRMKLQEKRLEVKSDDTEPVTTVWRPNNNNDLEDINSNLPVFNIMHLEETTNTCVNTQHSPEATNTARKISDVQNNVEEINTEFNINNSGLDTKNSSACVTRGYDSKVDISAVIESVSQSSMNEDPQIDEHITDNKSSRVSDSELNRRDVDMQYAEVLSVVSVEILKPESFATDDAEDANNSMSFETTISESKTYTTLPTKTKFVLSTEPDKLKQNKFLVTGGRTDTTFSYRLHKSLDDAPLVNVTDGLMRPVKDSTTLSAVDVGGADMSSININLQKSILVPLKIQMSLVNSAMLRFFLQDQGLLSHLHSLRNYFFLLDGEFGRNMTSMLFERVYQVACPSDLLNCVALNSILSKALTRPDPNMDRLSFGVKYIPPHFSYSSPLLLDCIVLQYRMAWPLNIIFTETALQKYNDIFGYLLRLRRISWVLEEDFHYLKREAEDKPGLLRSPQYHRLQLYRHEMTHFVRALQNYVTATVLQASWVEFLQKLQNACTLDDLYRIHVTHVKMVLFRCLLNKQSRSIQKALLDVLKMILKFHGQIHSQAWRQSGSFQYEHPKFDTMVQIYGCFHSLAVYTFKYATKLANTGYQPHLLDLLQMLNMNGFYPEHL
ncbi:gamma-tubulin complex component 6 isoform X3 [Zootermopsis nevadensis]|uniref:gamma-tubulin complex component 6 isoform X3 n=1 Tax=Zootermopsis nevadensis TaxID=136037 RepID=UPI000B8EB169|nr:gamma-tubulin complex component 6 isoform X3 [Zootermopsis nevadensis]